LGFNGDLYPTAGASVVMTTSGDMVKYQSGARARLGIGSANQILQVKSSLPSWETVDLADTVLTTAGDVLYENATPELARLGAGTQYFNLQMGASLPAWTASSSSTLTTQGDLLIASGANTLSRLARGSDNQVLTMNGTALNWETAGGGATVEIVEVRPTASFSTSSTTFVDITGMSLTKPDITDGKCMLVCEGTIDNSSVNEATALGLDDNATVVAVQSCVTDNAGLEFPISIADVSEADGETAKGVLKSHSSGTARILYDSTKYEPKISVLGVG